jgi:serine/threonine-protein kinase HipA
VAGVIDGWRDRARRAGIAVADIELAASAFSAHSEFRGGR